MQFKGADIQCACGRVSPKQLDRVTGLSKRKSVLLWTECCVGVRSRKPQSDWGSSTF